MSQRTKKPRPEFNPLLAGMLIGALISGGVFYFFSNSSVTLEIPIKAASDQKPDSTPEPRFDFYSELSQNEKETKQTNTAPTVIETTTETIVTKPAKPTPAIPLAVKKNIEYTVIVGTFKKGADADAVRAKLMLGGIEAKQVVHNINHEVWHKVQLGPFKTEIAAQHMQRHLRHEFALNSIIKTSK